jgi:DNA-binding response OmpR family regulator
MKRLLIVEDDENLSRGMAFIFERDGHSVITANTLQGGRAELEQNDIDVVILDLNLPDGDGMEFCGNIREKSNIPVIMLTARDMETDEVAGLSAGADDYITKPFSLSVLRARVEAVIRRSDSNDRNIVRSGKFTLDTGLCRLYRDGAEIPVSATEFRLLGYFMRNAGRVLSKEQILSAIWDSEGKYTDENTLHQNIRRLRAKIGDDPKSPETIRTVHGLGYIWTAGGIPPQECGRV